MIHLLPRSDLTGEARGLAEQYFAKKVPHFAFLFQWHHARAERFNDGLYILLLLGRPSPLANDAEDTCTVGDLMGDSVVGEGVDREALDVVNAITAYGAEGHGEGIDAAGVHDMATRVNTNIASAHLTNSAEPGSRGMRR